MRVTWFSLWVLSCVFACVALGQAISNPANPTDNPNQINVTTSYLYLAKMHYAGTWSSVVTYNSQDVVFYSGATYISLQVANLNQNPASASLYWIVVPGSGGGGSSAWGSITGTLSAQTDLNTALGLALAKASNLSDLGSASTARTNLGLGTAAIATGPAGAIVGTTDTQTLTNKSIAGSEVNSGTLPHAQLPTLLSADIPNNAANTSGLAGTATALAASPSNCSAGSYTLGINASGTAQNCTALPAFPAGTVVGTSDTQTLTNKSIAGSEVNSGTVAPANGGTGVANTASLTLGTSNVNLATLGTGIVKNTTTTGALSDAAAADMYGLWSGTCSSTTFLRGDGACAAPGGGGAPALSAVTAATGSNTIASGVNPQIWNWALTGSTVGMTFGETTAATSTGNSIVAVNTLTGSTALPVGVSMQGLANTPIPGISLLNTTAAATGASAQQYSPFLVIGGNGWKTTSMAASQSTNWQVYVLPVQGSTAPTEDLVFAPYINGSLVGATSGVTFLSNTSTTVPAVGFRGTADTGTGIGQAASGTFDLISSGVDQLHVAGSALTQAAAVTLGWASTTLTSSSTCDTCLTRSSAGLVAVNGGVASKGTKFTASGCSNGSTVGGASAGEFALGTNTCTVVITMNGATGLTAPNHWVCVANDLTAGTVLIGQIAPLSATQCSLNIPAGAGTTDTINFMAMAY